MSTILILSNKFHKAQKMLNELEYTHARNGPRNSRGVLTKDPKVVPFRNSHHRYIRKKQGRIARQKLMASEPLFIEVFAWIFDLQKRLKLNDQKFAKILGLTFQVIKLWRNYNRGCGGHFPSKRSFKKLIQLEKMASAEIIEIKNRSNIVSKINPGKKIKVPRLKRR